MPLLLHLPPHRLPRERLLELGPEQLSLEELLSVLLGSGCAEHTVHSLSSQVAQLLRYGSVSIATLARIPGIGPAKAATISAALQLARAVDQEDRHLLLSPQEVYESCEDLLTEKQEHLVVFFLTARHRPIHREVVTVGTASASLVHPREVFRAAILHNASSLVMAHNHPSGDATPSEADFQATQRIATAGSQLGIELLDHVICASAGFTSLRVKHPELFL